MRITIEFDPMAGTAQVTIPTFVKDGSVIQPAIEGTALNAGAYIDVAPEAASPEAVAIEVPQATHMAMEDTVHDAGRYVEIGPEEGPSFVGRQSTTARSATETESTRTPTIVDRF